MFPDLFSFTIAGKEFGVHSYGVLIAIGVYLGFLNIARLSKQQFGTTKEDTAELMFYLIIAAVLGGKLFFLLEDPMLYIQNPSKIWNHFGSGFTFLGSVFVGTIVFIIYAKKNRLPLLSMIDIIGITIVITHSFGRMGCFMAGCCYGVPTTSRFAVVFTNPACQAKPLHTALVPTQLIEVILNLGILVTLYLISKKKQFEGQIFLIYLIMYSVGRSFIEIYRGDLRRGFVIENILSYSQFYSIIIIAIAAVVYYLLYRKAKKHA